jgi:Tfp pilus assembly protein PilO
VKANVANIIGRFTSLPKREKTLIVFLVCIVLFSLYLNKIYKPMASTLNSLEGQYTSVQRRFQKIKKKAPDLAEEKTLLENEKQKLSSVKEKLASLEKEMPSYGRMPELLGELAEQAVGFDIEFISIRPKEEKGKLEYDQVIIEIVLESSYLNFMRYLNRLESFSQFLSVKNIVVDGIKDSSDNEVRVTLSFSILLGTEGRHIPVQGRTQDRDTEPLEIGRDPFTSDLKPGKEVLEQEKYKISGISPGGKRPTVIINDEVYSKGEAVGDLKVKEISINKVVLTDGVKDIVLEFGDI